MNIYDKLHSAVDMLAEEATSVEVDQLVYLRDVAALIERERLLDGLNASDARNVGVVVILDLVMGGVERLSWRADCIAATTDMFDDRAAALAAQRAIIAVIA